MHYVLMVVLMGILTAATNTLAASCDTDYTCFLLGSTDLLGTQEVHLAFNYKDKEIEDSISVTCDNGEIFITKEAEFNKSVNIMCSESAILNYPCTDDVPDYSGWCGSNKQKEQYKKHGIITTTTTTNTIPYNNPNSGIAAYILGDNYISIQFKSSKKLYLYSTNTYTTADIDEMKILAKKGKGLNSFLNNVKKRTNALQEIDNFCGDTWCEGKYNYNFLNIDKNWIITYQAINWENGEYTTLPNIGSCKITPFSNIIPEKVINQMSTCLDNFEKTL